MPKRKAPPPATEQPETERNPVVDVAKMVAKAGGPLMEGGVITEHGARVVVAWAALQRKPKTIARMLGITETMVEEIIGDIVAEGRDIGAVMVTADLLKQSAKGNHNSSLALAQIFAPDTFRKDKGDGPPNVTWNISFGSPADKVAAALGRMKTVTDSPPPLALPRMVSDG